MTDFFSLSTGESAISESGSFEASTTMENIPDNTDLVATPVEVKWAEDFNDANHISIRWDVLAPKEYAGRKLFQKIYVTDDKPNAKDPIAARDKAKSMLMAIDKNAGGHIAASGVMPTDESLTKFLNNKMMVIKVLEWSMEVDGQTKSGNWISAVSPKGAVKTSPASTPGAQSQAPAPEMDSFDKDIPF